MINDAVKGGIMGKRDTVISVGGHKLSEYELMLVFRQRYLEDKFGKLTEDDVTKTRANMRKLETKAKKIDISQLETKK